jgi:neutral ceramidase
VIKCGMSRVDITPRLGLNMPGYLALRSATGVKDKLYAKAIVLDDGKVIIGLVAIDALDLELNDVIRIRKKIHEFTGILEDNIMVCSTHTHTGGPVVNSFVTKRDEEYIKQLANSAADAVILAYYKMQPVRIGTEKGFIEDISFNRRYFMKDGNVKTNPGRLNPMIDKAAGPIDPDVMVIKVEDIEGNIIGAVVNFACHLDVVGGNEYSADYAGELRKVLKAIYGDGFICVFLNGLSGNINHINVNTDKEISPFHYKKMGRILAGETVKVLTQINGEEYISIDSKKEVLSIPQRRVTEEELKKAKEEMESENTSKTDKIFANEVLEFNRNRADFTNVEAQVLRIGNATITGFSGDVFVEFGLNIKNKSPFDYNLISSHTNGRNGYIPIKEAFEQGGYEVRTTRSNKLTYEAGDLLTEAVLKLMRELKKNS